MIHTARASRFPRPLIAGLFVISLAFIPRLTVAEEGAAAGEVIVRVGETVEGEVTEESPVVHSPTLDGSYGGAPLRGVGFTLNVETAGSVTIDLRSYLFDAYLVLEAESGEVIAEDDDGLIGTQSRIVAEVGAGRYAVRTCALHGGLGRFELNVRAGATPTLTGPERAALEIEDAVRAVEAREAAFGASHSSTAASLANLADLYQSQGRYADAERLYLRAIEIHDAELGPDHPTTALVLNNLAALYYSQGRYDDTEPLFLRAVEIYEAKLGPDHPYTATGLNNLADLHESQGRYAEAEPLVLRALEIAESKLGPDHPTTASFLNNLASLYRSLGRPADAEPLFLRALKIREGQLGPDHPSTAESLNNLAYLYDHEGRYAEAEPLYLRALEITQSQLGPNHPSVISSLGNLAGLYESQGRYAEAEPLVLRALEVAEFQLGPNHPSTAISLGNVASVYESQGRYAEAEPLYLRTLKILESQLGEDHPSTAVVLNNLAILYQSQGRYVEAEPLTLRALEIWESQLGVDHPTTADALNNLAALYKPLGRYADAEPYYLRALLIRESKLGRDHPSTARSLNNLADLYEFQGRHEDALRLRVLALDSENARVVRELLLSPSGSRLSIAASQRDTVDETLMEWFSLVEPRPPVDTIYRPISAWKGVAFRTASRLARARSAMKGDPLVQELRGALANLEGQASALAYAEQIDDPAGHKTRLLELREQRRRTEQALLIQLGLAPELEATDGAELSRVLPAQSAALDFLVHRPWISQVFEDGKIVQPSRWAEQRLLCFVTVAGASPVLVDLGNAATLRATTGAWLDQLTRGQRGMAPEEWDDLPSPADLVREQLLDPLLAVLPPETTRLFIIPDDFVGEVPFGAISLRPDQYLLELVDIVYVTDPISLRDLLDVETAPIDAAPSILAVGGVDYDVRSDTPEHVAPALPSTAELRSGRSGFARKWGPLTNTSIEVDGVLKQAASTWPEMSAPELLKSTEATEEAIKTNAPGHSILHFATHGFFQRDGLRSIWQSAMERSRDDHQPLGLGGRHKASARPNLDAFAGMPALEGEEPGMLAGLVLAGANLDPSLEPDRDDGILTATEVASLDLSACRLAVLSACQTSVGVGQSGEGLQSLRRGFHEAGADAVIASLWKVDDVATQQLMHQFYEELWKNRCGPGEALRRARLELMRERKDPYYWGAFTLSGEWR